MFQPVKSGVGTPFKKCLLQGQEDVYLNIWFTDLKNAFALSQGEHDQDKPSNNIGSLFLIYRMHHLDPIIPDSKYEIWRWWLWIWF